MSLRSDFLDFDDRLARHGVHPLTDWWREGIGRWLDAYEAGGAVELTACVGRGAAKSTALYKLAAFFALFGGFTVPPGERHYAIVLSRLKEEASKAVPIVSRWLTLLGVGHRVVGDVLDLSDLPRGIRIVAASVASTSGWRAFFVGKDERSKWPFGGVEEMEAEEIDTSAAAMTATHARAPMLSFGSAWGDFGAFFDAVRGGSTGRRIVLGPAPSWVAAPHLKVEDLRRKEPDPRRFAREYECVFSSAVTSAFDVADVAAAIRAYDVVPSGPPIVVIDSSSGRGDAFCWCVAQWGAPELTDVDRFVHVPANSPGADYAVFFSEKIAGPASYLLDSDGRYVVDAERLANAHPILCVYGIQAVEGRLGERFDFDATVDAIARTARTAGALVAVSDQHNEAALRAGLARHQIAHYTLPWTGSSKPPAVTALRRVLRDRQLAIAPCSEAEVWRREMLQFRESITPAGSLTYGARRGGHDDRVALTLTLMMADEAGLMRGSPLQVRRGKTEFDPTSPP